MSAVCPSQNELQFFEGGPTVIVRGTFLDLDEQPIVEQRSRSAPVLGQSCDDDAPAAQQEFARTEPAYSWCVRDGKSCDKAKGKACDTGSFLSASNDSTTDDSGSDSTSCGENEDATDISMCASSDVDEEVGDKSALDGVQDHEEFEMGYGEFDETLAIESDMAPCRWPTVTDLEAEPTQRDYMSSPPVLASRDDTVVTALTCEGAERWADQDFEEAIVIEPELTILTPTPPPTDIDLAKDLTMNFDTVSGVCGVQWKLPAKYFNSTNTTKTSQVFKVFFGRALNCRILLQPKNGSWKKSNGDGRMCLKIDDELPEGTILHFRFILGHCPSQHGPAIVHDFSKSNMKYTDEFMNFIPPAGEDHVFITAEFLRAEEPGWQ